MLFDGSELDVAENTRQTIEVVAEAERHGAHVEGEIETVAGVEDGIGSDDAGRVHPVEVSAKFIEETGVYSFAPAIGTAHGLYKSAPELRPERVTELVALHPIPMVLHGGTGLTEAQFADLISRGCAKVNISTALKIAFVESHREYLEANPGKHDPPSLLAHVREAVKADGRPPHRDVRVSGKARARRVGEHRLSLWPCSKPTVPALIFDCDGVLADTERDGHRAGLQRDVRGGRAAGHVVGGGVRGEAEDRRRQGADGGAADTDEFVATNGAALRPRRASRR